MLFHLQPSTGHNVGVGGGGDVGGGEGEGGGAAFFLVDLLTGFLVALVRGMLNGGAG